ncbi:potassium transporter TrkA, partial [bacterium]|nr:potassium transporter TrkA [bacterium]
MQFIGPFVTLVSILIVGTIGYWFIGERNYSVLDCFYMTIITIISIGYGEIIDMTGKPYGRVFTIIVALSGIGVLTYTFSYLTAFLADGNFAEGIRRKRMEKILAKMKDHFIICGIGKVGLHILNELNA